MATTDAVILLHGFGGLPIQTALLARRLRTSGYTVANIGYPSWRWPIDRVLDHLHQRITAAPARLAAGTLVVDPLTAKRLQLNAGDQVRAVALSAARESK